jgi:hypothetical protein
MVLEENLPSAHLVQMTAPVLVDTDPAGQTIQAVIAWLFWYLPAAQGVQAPAISLE